MKVPNRQLQNILVAISVLQNGRTRPGGETVPPEKLPALTGVKLSRLRRAVHPAFSDVEEARKETALRYGAELKEDGDLRADSAGRWIFPDPEARVACEKELLGLLDAEVEVTETLRISDFRRTVRDPETHQVRETDEIEPDVMELLFDVLDLTDEQ